MEVKDQPDQTRHHQDEQMSEKRVVAGNINDDQDRLPHVAAGPDSHVLTATDLPQLAKTEIERNELPNPTQIDPVVSNLLTGWRLGLVILPLCIGTLLVAIDNTIIGVAVPQISTVFKALDDVGWYGSAYLLTETALQPIFGNVYKYFNIKAVYLISIVIFELGSILCAAAPNSPIFILGRAIAGFGAGGIYQGALSIIALTVPRQQRPFYISIVLCAFVFATCFGPILGGVLTSKVSWRWCFWINLPIGAVTILLVVLFLKAKTPQNEDRKLPFKTKLIYMDFGGTAILVAAVCCMLLALQWGGTKLPWRSSKIIGLLVGFGLLTCLFGYSQYRLGDRATIPRKILLQRSILMGCGYIFFINMSNYTDGYFLPFYFQAARDLSAIRSGINFVPLALPEVFALIVVGGIISKFNHYVPFMVLGTVIGTIGTGLLTRIDQGTSTVEWAAYMVLTGLGIGIGVNVPFTAVQVVLSENDLAVGNALVLFFSRLGGVIAVPLGNSILIDGVVRRVSARYKDISSQSIIRAGPTNLTMLTDNPDTLSYLRFAYSKGITSVLYYALGAIAITLPFALGMEWKRLDTVQQNETDDEKANSKDDQNAISSPSQHM